MKVCLDGWVNGNNFFIIN